MRYGTMRRIFALQICVVALLSSRGQRAAANVVLDQVTAIFAAAGMETMLIGPIGHGLHSAEEWVDLASVVDLATILADTAVNYLTR